MKIPLEQLLELFEIGDVLGTGAFSEVKLATKRATGEKFAMKIIDRAKCKGKESMIETEVNILLQVQHDNIIQLHEMYEIDNKIYLLMQLVTGGELFDDIVKRVKYTEADASKIIHKILEAVSYLHEKKIAHRDLKPENLLLSDRSANPKVMLSDFGLSKILDDDEVMRTACGTPGYVAPEVLRKRGYGPEVDLWSIGVISYILLCGYPPFYDSNNAVLFRQIMSGRFEFDRPWWDNVSEEAKDFIRNLLVLDPQQRFTTAQALEHPFIARYGHKPASLIIPMIVPTTQKEGEEALGIRARDLRQDEPNLAAVVCRELGNRGSIKVDVHSVQEDPCGRPISKKSEIDDSGCISSNSSVNGNKTERLEVVVDEKSRLSVQTGRSSTQSNRLSTQSAKTAVNESRPTSTVNPLYTTIPRTTSMTTRVRVLSYNINLRPPGIKNNLSDHKNERLNVFGTSVLALYDVVCLQEMFSSGSTRMSKLLFYAKKAGLDYHVASPCKGLLNASVDGGLIILSRYPIVKTEKITFKRGIYGDRYAAKGAIYAKINVTPNHSIHVFNTHLQSSANSVSTPDMTNPHGAEGTTLIHQSQNYGGQQQDASATSLVRLQQISALKDFVDDIMRVHPNEPVLLAADLNVNSRASRSSGKIHSEEYVTLMRMLRGELVLAGRPGSAASTNSGSGSERQTPSAMAAIPNILKLHVTDVIYEASGKEHPITFGDVVQPGKDMRPTETVLTPSDGFGACASTDYILWLERSRPSSNAFPVTIDVKASKVETFLVEGEPYTQLSDHYGLSTYVYVHQ